MKKLNLESIKYQMSIALILPLFFCSCQKQTEKKPEEANNAAPQVAGIWKTFEDHPWQLTLSEDGKVTDIVRFDGLHFVISEGFIEYKPAENIYAKYVFGPCMWNYDPASRRLDVILTIDDMVVQTDQQGFKCSFTDEFSGTLSEDGTTWTPTWIMTQKFTSPQNEQVFDNGAKTFKKIQ